MTTAREIFQGRFGRVALLDIDRGLVEHAHPHCHVLIKMGGADSGFRVRGQSCPLTDHTMVLINAWEQHAYTPMGESGPTLILALYIEPDWLAEVDRAFGASGLPGFFPAPVAPIGPRIRCAAETLAVSLGAGGDGSDQLALLDRLMVQVIERASMWRNRRVGHALCRDFRVRKAVEQMRRRIGETFTLEEIAREVGLSRAQLFRGFQSNLGVTPKLYYNSLRVEAAVRSLAEDSEPLGEVAERLGFSMQGHFTRFFRGNLGITPSHYRQVVRLAQPQPALRQVLSA